MEEEFELFDMYQASEYLGFSVAKLRLEVKAEKIKYARFGKNQQYVFVKDFLDDYNSKFGKK